MKKIVILAQLVIVVFFSYAGPKYDAVYHLISKSYTLNADGSVDFHFRKELQLFTTSAFDTYGETFIPYNTEFQTLTINEAYTVRKDGSIVKTPQNAFNPSLPAGCVNCERFNTIREMVVTHTALEYDATIVLDYTIHTTQPFMPELMERVDLYENAPIDRYEIAVNFPKDKPLNYYLNYQGGNMTQTQSCNADSTVQSMQWVYTNLDQNPNIEYMVRDYLPYMLLTTVASPDVFMGHLVLQNAFSNLNTDMYRSVLNEICPDTLTEMQKIVAIRDYVADNIYTNQVPMKMMNYIVASPAYVWSTNCGNAFEKDLLLFSMLRSMGFSANVGLMFNDLMSDPKSLVNVSVDGRNYFITAAEKTNMSMENQYALDSYIPVTGEVTPFDAYPTHIYVDASIQVERVSGKMRPQVKVNKDTIITQKMNVLVPEAKQLAITEVEVLNGNYYSVTIEDGPYGCDLLPELLDQERSYPVSAPLTNETYRYEITLPERTRWVGKNFLYEQTYDFGRVKIQYQYEGNKLVIVRELEILTNFIDGKSYKKFRRMIADWYTPRLSVFAYERQ